MAAPGFYGTLFDTLLGHFSWDTFWKRFLGHFLGHPFLGHFSGVNSCSLCKIVCQVQKVANKSYGRCSMRRRRSGLEGGILGAHVTV